MDRPPTCWEARESGPLRLGFARLNLQVIDAAGVCRLDGDGCGPVSIEAVRLPWIWPQDARELFGHVAGHFGIALNEDMSRFELVERPDGSTVAFSAWCRSRRRQSHLSTFASFRSKPTAQVGRRPTLAF